MGYVSLPEGTSSTSPFGFHRDSRDCGLYFHQHIHMHGPPSWQCYDSCDPHGETGVHVFF